MDWYYLSDNHERIAVSEAQLATLAARGVIRPATPLWRKGMGDWAASGEVRPEIFTSVVSGAGDHPHPAAEGTAVRGTVTGLARTLTAYNVWLRIFAAGCMVLALAGIAAVGWQVYYVVRYDLAAFRELHPLLKLFPEESWQMWVVAGVQLFFLLAIFGNSWFLLLAANRGRHAAAGGNENLLASALRDIGRYFVIAAVVLILAVAVTLATVLLGNWEKAFPPEAPSKEKGVTI